jgi:hypothetical protein
MCQSVDSIECELAAYRKGFINIRLDLARGLIVWKDSNHWSNNFVRSLTFTEIEIVRRLLPDMYQNRTACVCKLPGPRLDAAVVATENSGHGSFYSWQLTLKSNEECWCINGNSTKAELWRKVVKTIEQISKLPVRIQ